MDQEILKELLEIKKTLSHVVTKNDLKKETAKYATKDEIIHEFTKYATKNDLTQELAKYATKNDLTQELAKYATKNDLSQFASKADLMEMKKALIKEIRNTEVSITLSVDKYKAEKRIVDDLTKRITKLEHKISV